MHRALRRLQIAPLVVTAVAITLTAVAVGARQVMVRHPEGLLHGFLSLRSLDGVLLADGDLVQTARASRVTSRLVFHFRDGSLHDETAVFTQGRTFRLVTDHLVQRGPSFPQPLDMSIDVPAGQITVLHADGSGAIQRDVAREALPANLANGLMPTLLKNVRSGGPVPEMTLAVATPKPRLVRLSVAAVGEDDFVTSGRSRKAMHYVVHVKLSGLTGLIAPLFGKQPPDSHVWILQGEAPAFIRAEQPLYADGPVWRIELVSPSWPAEPR